MLLPCIEYGISRNFKPYPKQKEAFFVLKTYPYNQEKAAVYAKKWAFERNPRYMRFEGATVPVSSPNACLQAVQ